MVSASRERVLRTGRAEADVHELHGGAKSFSLAVLAVDRPKLYMKLVTLVSELGLSINQAQCVRPLELCFCRLTPESGVCGVDGIVQNIFEVRRTDSRALQWA